MKVHLHSEQFDGWMHAQCGRLDVAPSSPHVVDDDAFERTPRARRCRLCAQYNWPHGCEPDSNSARIEQHTARDEPDCRTCGGTGRLYVARSWFPADGYQRIKCGICDGTGKSGHRDDPSYVRWQAARRAEHRAA